LRASYILPVVILALVTGCGGGGGGGGNPGGGGGGGGPVSVAVNPNSLLLNPGSSYAFSANVTGGSSSAVNWSVQEGTSGGSITPGGLYVAPTTAGTFHVVATSQADASKSATATVTVSVEVSVKPTSATITIGDTLLLTANVLGSANPAVTWSVQEGAAGGTITSAGLYTPPNAAGTFHVVATSQADPTKSASAAVTVETGGGSIIIH
jgi:hypothetical protein